MTLSTFNQDLFSKDAQGYFQVIDFNQVREIYEISKDIQDVEDTDHRDYLKEFDAIEIEYPDHSFALGC